MSDIIPQNDTPQKRCYKCNKVKPCTLEHFGSDKRTSDGFRSVCKVCRHVEYQEALERNPDMNKVQYQKTRQSFESIERQRAREAAYMHNYRKKKRAMGICAQCGVNPSEPGHYCDQCKEYMYIKKEDYRHKWPEYGKTDRDKLRKEVLEAYGNKCACCGETQQEFLAIDHVNNDGKEHRREVGPNIYRWLRRNGFPQDRFQILCQNCNWAKHTCGICPHQIKTS